MTTSDTIAALTAFLPTALDADDAIAELREAIISFRYADAMPHLLRSALNALLTNDRETLTDIALALSLCPLHLIDYAICFDDETPECAPIRIIHPSYDS